MDNKSTSSDADHAQIQELFQQLDKNRDGRIDFDELNEYFREKVSSSSNKQTGGSSKTSTSDEQARKLFDSISKSSTQPSATQAVIENFDFRDFVDYVNRTDRKIELIFKNLDRDQNGIIDKTEIKEGFENLGICLSESQIEKLLAHLDKNNSLQIDWKEWRDFFRFAPHDRFEEALRHWRQETFVDYADQAIPADFTVKEKQSGLWWRSLVAGGVAGAISRTCTAPLDRVRIFLQVHGVSQNVGIVGTFRSMLKEGGARSLWRGNFINVLKITPESAIKFGAYEHIKKMMGQEGQQLPVFQKFLSGTLAGFMAQSAIYPMEVLKTRLALRKTGEFNGISDCARKIYRKEGMRAFYRGYLMNTLGIAGVGVDLAIYETLKAEYKKAYPNSSQPSTVALLVISNTSSSLAMLSTYPIFLIRTKLQSSTNAKERVLSIAGKIWRTNGFFGFYKGALANLAKVAPAASIGYISYEKTSAYLGISK